MAMRRLCANCAKNEVLHNKIICEKCSEELERESQTEMSSTWDCEPDDLCDACQCINEVSERGNFEVKKVAVIPYFAYNRNTLAVLCRTLNTNTGTYVYDFPRIPCDGGCFVIALKQLMMNAFKIDASYEMLTRWGLVQRIYDTHGSTVIFAVYIEEQFSTKIVNIVKDDSNPPYGVMMASGTMRGLMVDFNNENRTDKVTITNTAVHFVGALGEIIHQWQTSKNKKQRKAFALLSTDPEQQKDTFIIVPF